MWWAAIFLLASSVFCRLCSNNNFEDREEQQYGDSTVDLINYYFRRETLGTKATELHLDDPVIIPWGSQSFQPGNADTRSRNYIMSSLQSQSSSLLMYPYSFSVDSEEFSSSNDLSEGDGTVVFDEGAFLKLDGIDGLSQSNVSSYFYWFQALNGVDVTRGASLYRTNIATLKFSVPIDPNTYEIVESSETTMDLVTGGSSACNIFKVYDSSFSTCYNSIEELDNYLNNNRLTASNSYFSFIEVHELVEGGLFDPDTGEARFGMMIIPDVYQGREEYIANAIGGDGAEQLRKFVKEGGLLYTLGKGASVLDHLDSITTEKFLVSEGENSTFFNYSQMAYSSTEETNLIQLAGCGKDVFERDPPEVSQETSDEVYRDLLKRTLCFTLNRTNDGVYTYSSLSPVYTPYPEMFSSSGFEEIESINPVGVKTNNPIDGGEITDLPSDSHVPALFYKQIGKGKLIVSLHNAANGSVGVNYVLNTYLLACQRPVLVEINIEGSGMIKADDVEGVSDGTNLIPAGEQVTVLVDFSLVNLGTGDLSIFDTTHKCQGSTMALYLSTPKGIEGSLPSSTLGLCTEYSYSDITEVELSSSTDPENPVYVCCADPSLGILDRFNVQARSSITTYEATIQGDNVPIINYVVQYNKEGISIVESDSVRARAAEAARLEAVINPDPSSWYPLKGKGMYTDSVLVGENKSLTSAKDVLTSLTYLLITPIVDGSDQELYTRGGYMDVGYYSNTMDFEWVDTCRDVQYCSDRIDYFTLYDRGDYLAADWDAAASVSVFESNMNLDRADPDNLRAFSSTIINSSYNVWATDLDEIYQSYSPNPDVLLKHATQRLIAVLDSVDNRAAQTLRNDGVLDETDMSKSNPSIGKSNVIFARNDIYFYNHDMYPVPTNLGLGNDVSGVVFTCDRFSTASVQGRSSSEKYEDGQGVYESNQPYVESSWENELLLSDSVAIYPFLSREELESLGGIDNYELLNDSRMIQSLPEGYSSARTYGLMPIEQYKNYIKVPEDVVGFGGDGHHELYKELGIVYALSISLTIPEGRGLRGGIIEISLDKSLEDAVNNFSFVPYSNMGKPVSVVADKVAVTESSIEFTDTDAIVRFTFLRGQTPEEIDIKETTLTVNVLIDSNQKDNVDPTVKSVILHELQYVLGGEEGGLDFTSSEPFEVDIESVSSSIKLMFILPAIEMKFKRALNPDEIEEGDQDENTSTEQESSIVSPLEYVDPLTRLGTYTQELYHRPLHGHLEVHTNERPIVATTGGFTVYQNIGTSSIPFRDYVSTGEAVVIPSTPVTSHMEWSDIWGRRFYQPLRTVIPDVPPIPPPVRSFVLGETYEILDAEGNRLDYWPSEQTVDLHVTLKLRNGYPKYFEITNCEANNILHVCRGVGCPGAKPHIQVDELTGEYILPNTVTIATDEEIELIKKNNVYHSHYTHSAEYGLCYTSEDRVLMSGRKVSDEYKEKVKQDYDFSECKGYSLYNDTFNGIECHVLTAKNFTDSLIPEEDRDQWNFSSLVNDYYPKGYIDKDTMWQLVHMDYADSDFEKAYPYHLDNTLPSAASGTKDKPDNLIYYGIYKGLGYSISYNKTHTNPSFGNGEYYGWFSNQLQSKDYTLLAGQEISVDIPDLQQEPLIDDSDFVHINNLNYIHPEDHMGHRLYNKYVCHYNPYVYSKYTEGKFYYPSNIYKNYVVPIDPEDTTESVSDYVCQEDSIIYTPKTISQANNLLSTDLSRDYLYFASALRGEAKEDIHIITTISPLKNNILPYVGTAKISEGSYLNYWNPANGPNSYQQVLGPAIVVQAKSNYLTIETKALSPSVTTFNSEVYVLFTVSDPLQPAIISADTESLFDTIGYGNMMVETYTGGWNGYKAVLTYNEDEEAKTVVKVEFSNNIGYDIEMLGNAIEFEYIGSEPINANDLLSGTVSAILSPIEYNFLSLDLGPEDGILKQCLEFKPFQFVAGAAPQFFDFPSTNVVTIKDGWKGTYFYEVTLKCSLAGTEYEGKKIEIPVTVNSEYFSNWPNDEKKTYNPPPIQIAIGYETGDSIGTARYCPSGQISDLTITPTLSSNVYDGNLDSPFVIESSVVVNEDDILALQQASLEADFTTALSETYADILSNHDQSLMLDTIPYKPQFDIFTNNSVNIVAKITSDYCASGYRTVLTETVASYIDFKGDSKMAMSPGTNDKPYASSLGIQARGAWMTMSPSSKIFVETEVTNEDGVVSVQEVEMTKIPTNSKSWIEISIVFRNSGDATAYRMNPMFNLSKFISSTQPDILMISDGVSNVEDEQISPNITENDDSWGISFMLGKTVSPGEQIIIKFRVEAPVLTDDDVNTSNDAAVNVQSMKVIKNDTNGDESSDEVTVINKNVTILNGGSVNMDLTSTEGGNNVDQSISAVMSVVYRSVIDGGGDEPVIPEPPDTGKNDRPVVIGCSVTAAIILIIIIVTIIVLCLKKKHRKAQEAKSNTVENASISEEVEAIESSETIQQQSRVSEEIDTSKEEDGSFKMPKYPEDDPLSINDKKDLWFIKHGTSGNVEDCCFDVSFGQQ